MDTNSAVTKKTFARSLHVKTVKGYEITKRDIETDSVLRGKIIALEQIGIYPDRPCMTPSQSLSATPNYLQ
jgi:hypothetical protein